LSFHGHGGQPHRVRQHQHPAGQHAQSDRATFRFRHGQHQREDLYFQVNDGISGPTISSVDILSGTIFASTTQGRTAAMPHRVITAALRLPSGDSLHHTSSGTVLDNGLLATVTLDTNRFAGNGFRWPSWAPSTATLLLALSGTNVIPINPAFPPTSFTIHAHTRTGNPLLVCHGVADAGPCVRRRRTA